MNYKKIFSYSLFALIFTLVGFGGGFLTGKSISNEIEEHTQTPQISLESYNYQPITEEEPPPSEIQEKYLLKNEGNTLTLYRISDEITSIIKSITINTGFLPLEDRIKLENGIYFDNVEDGFQLIEDFTS